MSGFDTAKTINQWQQILYRVKDQLEVLQVDPEKIKTSQPNPCTVYLEGLKYKDYAAHITLTPGPKDTLKWQYFHLTVNMAKGGHVFFCVNEDSQVEITTKVVGLNPKDVPTLKEAHEHNKGWANDERIKDVVKEDIGRLIQEISAV